jgi:hypothetical protein
MSTASLPSSNGVEKAILAAEEDLKAFLNSAEDPFYLMLSYVESHAATEQPEALLPERLKVSCRRVLTARTAVLTQADVPRDGRPWYKRGGGEKKLTDSEAAEALNLSVGVFRLQVKPELETHEDGIPIAEIELARRQRATRIASQGLSA